MELLSDIASSSIGHWSRPLLGQRTRSQGSTSVASISGSEDVVARDDDHGIKAGQSSRELRREIFSGEQRNRSRSRGSGRVEKRIEATLPEAEQPLNARSRKSSHVLGLFKENTTSLNIKKAQDRAKTDLKALSDRSVQRVENTPIAEQESERSHPPPAGEISEEPVILSEDLAVAGVDRNEHPVETAVQEHKIPQRKPTSSPELNVFSSQRIASVPRDSEDGKLASLISAGIYGDQSRRKPNQADFRTSQHLPEEITASQHLVVPLIEEPCTYCTRISVTDPNHTDEAVAHQHLPAVGENLNENAGPSLVANGRGAVGDDEEESDKEQISSALYYPHQAPSPDAQEDPNISPEENGKGSRNFENPQLDPLPPAALNIEVQSEDVNIALQSYNQSRYLHGDLSQSWVSQGGDANKGTDIGASSVSGSDYEDEDETTMSTNGEDSSQTDELETTPTATPIAKNSLRRSRDRKHRRRASAPIRAVELKPYSHQVGGHSTVFRFSRRAVCKQLSNRENEFYEVVEREHSELLSFLPRYALNRSHTPSFLVGSRC